MLWVRSKKQKAEEEARAEAEAESLEQAHGEALAKNRKLDAREAKREEASKLGASGGMLSTLQAIYVEQVDQGEMIEESDEHLEDIHAELEGSASEQRQENFLARQEKIKGSNKDKRDSFALGKFASGVKGAFGKVGDAFGSVKETLSGKLGLVAIGGLLVLMNKYSDELFGPEGALTKLLEWMKNDMIPAIKKLYDWVVVGWDKAWSGTVAFFEWAHGIFTKISDYINSFDVDGEKGLSPDEMKKLQDDLVLKVGEFVSSVMGGIVGSIAAWSVAFFAVGGLGWQFLKGRAFRAGAGIVNAGGPVKDVVKKASLWSKIFGGGAGSAMAANTMILDKNKLPKGTKLNKVGSLVHAESGVTKKGVKFKAGDIIKTAQKLQYLDKYPRAMSAARKIPFLGPILTSAMAIQLLHSDASHDEKVIGLGRLIFGTAGSIGAGMLGAKLGAAIGSAFPVAGTIIGAVLGGFGGYYGGEWVGEKAAQWLLGKESDKDDIISTESLYQDNISALNVKKEEVLAAQKGLSPSDPQFKANQETLGYIDQALAIEQTGLDEAPQSDTNLQMQSKTNRLAVVNKTIANEKYLLPTVAPTHPNALSKYNDRKDRIADLEKQRDALLSDLESLQFIPTTMIPAKIAYDTPGKMQQYMTEYKQAVTSTGTKWTDRMNQDAYNYAVNQVSADQNTNNNINYYDGSMGVHQRDMPTNILNSELQYAAGWGY